MKRSLIHPGFFRELFRRLRTKGLVAAILLAGLNLIFFIALLTRDPIGTGVTHYDPRLMALPMLFVLYIFTPVMVFGAYHWLNKRAESDFYHAIPLTRTQIYATTSAAILTWLLIALGSFAAVHAILYAAFGLPFNHLLYLCVFLNMLIASVEITAAFSIGAALCGRIFPALFQSIAVLFLPRILLSAFWILTEIDSGYTLPFSQLPFFLNPEYNIAATPAHSLIYGINFANVPAMLYSLVMSFGLLVLGGVAFRKRKSELAEIPYASKALQIATRVMFGLPSLSTIVVLLNIYVRFGFEEDFMPGYILVPLVVTSVLFSFIFFCLYELIASKKMKAVVKAMPTYGICIAVALVLIFAPFGVAKLRRLTPISADEIKSYRFTDESTLVIPSNVGGADSYPDYLLHRYTFRDDRAKALLASMSKDNCMQIGNNEYALIDYNIHAIVSTGGLVKKTVTLSNYDFYNSNSFGYGRMEERLAQLCLEDPAFSEQIYAFPKGRIIYAANGLALSEAQEVGRLFREDYEKLTNEQRQSLMLCRSDVFGYGESAGPMGLTITLYGSYGADNFTMNYRVNALTPNAAKTMLQYLNARNGEAVKKELKALKDWMDHPSSDPDMTLIDIGTRSFGTGAFWEYSDDQRLIPPKEAHPTLYRIIKALSEAPLTDDPARCVTFSTENYDMSAFASVITRYTAGFAADEETIALVNEWVADYEIDPYEIDLDEPF